MNNILAEPITLNDGRGHWIFHLGCNGRTLCGRDDIKLRITSSVEVNCDKCSPSPIICHDDIDLLVGVYGWADNLEDQVTTFMHSLCSKCNLAGVNVFFVERLCLPVSDRLKDTIHKIGFTISSCPLLPFDNCREDTSQFCDWMINNTGSASWVIISHFDIVFKGDYIRYLRSLMNEFDIIGNHHNGIVAVRRATYHVCQVGFCGVGNICVAYDSNLPRIICSGSPIPSSREPLLQLDVGELLILRMGTLGFKIGWLKASGGAYDSDLFVHSRQGSGYT